MAHTLAAVSGGVPQSGAPDVRRVVQPANLNRWTSRTFGSATPETVNAVLRAAERGDMRDWCDLAEYMTETDPHIRGLLGTRYSAVVATPWEVLPAEHPDEQGAAAAALFIQRVLQNTPDLERKLLDLLNGIGTGFAASELLYRRDSNAWVSAPTWVHPRRFNISETLQLVLYDDGAYPYPGTPLPADKFIVHMPRDTAQYPTRAGVLRSCVWQWLFCRWAEKYYLSGAERMANPMPVGVVPANATGTVRETLRAALENMSSDHAGIVEEGTRVDFLNAAFAGAADVWQGLIKHCRDNMTKGILGSLDAVDGGGSGSRARAETQADTTIEPRIEQDAKGLTGSLERDWFGPLLRFNAHLFGGRVPPTPRMVFRRPADNKVEQIYQYHLRGSLVTRDEVRSQLGLDPLGPERGGDDLLDIVDQPQGASPASPVTPADIAGGEAIDVPFVPAPRRRRPKPARTSPRQTALFASSPTTRTCAPSLTTALDAALSRSSGGRQS